MPSQCRIIEIASFDHRCIQAALSKYERNSAGQNRGLLTRPLRNMLTFRSITSRLAGGVLGCRADCTVCRIYHRISAPISPRSINKHTFSRRAATRFICSSSGALTARLAFTSARPETLTDERHSRRDKAPDLCISRLHLHIVSLILVPSEQVCSRSKGRFLRSGRREQG